MGGLKHVPEWVKGCDTGSCVEVWQGTNSVMVRNSELPQQITVFSPDEWSTFLEAVKRGHFDVVRQKDRYGKIFQ